MPQQGSSFACMADCCVVISCCSEAMHACHQDQQQRAPPDLLMMNSEGIAVQHNGLQQLKRSCMARGC